MQTRLSILALTNYDPTIWDDFSIPAEADRQAAIDYICLHCAELSLVYTDPEILRQQIKLWTIANTTAWNRMWAALEEEYNPLHNYDRHEQWSDAGTAQATGSNTTKVAGYNQTSGFTDRDKTEQSTGSNSTGTHDGHIYGNIGVTTNAQMLTGELDVRQRTNFYWILLTSFKNEFCLQIY